jgi:hypothetical protein
LVDVERDFPLWAIRLVIDGYRRERDDKDAIADRKRLRNDQRKKDSYRSWRQTPDRNNEHFHYDAKVPADRKSRSRHSEEVLKLLHKRTSGSLVKVRQILESVTKEIGCEELQMVSYANLEKMKRARMQVERLASVARLLHFRKHTTDAVRVLGVLFALVAPLQSDCTPGEDGQCQIDLQRYFRDFGIKDYRKVNYITAASTSMGIRRASPKRSS